MGKLRGVTSGLDASVLAAAATGRADVHISAREREMVVDWTAEIAGKFKTQVHTLVLAVYYFDRLIALKFVPRENAKKVAGVCLMLVCKTEEEVQPVIAEIAFVCGEVRVESVSLTELYIMKALDYKLGVPTAGTVVQWVCARRALRSD